MLSSRGFGTSAGLLAALVPLVTGAILGLGFVRTRPTLAEAKLRATWSPWPRRLCLTLLLFVATPGLLLVAGLLVPKLVAPSRNPAMYGPTVVSPRSAESPADGEVGGLPQILPAGKPSPAAMKWHFAWKQLEEDRKKAEVGLVAPRGPEILAAERDLSIAEAEFRGNPLDTAVAKVTYAKAILNITRQRFAAGEATQAEVDQAALAFQEARQAVPNLRSLSDDELSPRP